MVAAEEKAKAVDIRQQLETTRAELQVERDSMQIRAEELRTKSLKDDIRNEMVLKELSALKMEKRELRKKLDEATEQLTARNDSYDAAAKKATTLECKAESERQENASVASDLR